jgi:hypothetical protein
MFNIDRTEADKSIPQFKVWCKKSEWFLKEEQCLIDCDNKVYLKPTIEYKDLLEIDVTICRFTGLFDINNIPAYENDIVKVDDEIYYIDLVEEGMFFVLRHKLLKYDIFNVDCNIEFEIVGNKFQNCELLGGTNE